MNYLIITSSILCTLLSIISLYFITTTAMHYIDEYITRQAIRSKLHPEVTLEDLENDEDILYVTFDTTLINMVMGNTDAEVQEPISTMLMERFSDDDDDDEE